MLAGVYLKDLLRQCSLKEIYFLGNAEKIAIEIKTNTHTHKKTTMKFKDFMSEISNALKVGTTEVP